MLRTAILMTLLGGLFLLPATFASSQFVILTKPVEVPLFHAGKPVGKMTVPAGSRLPVVSQSDSQFVVRTNTGNTVSVSTQAASLETADSSLPEAVPSPRSTASPAPIPIKAKTPASPMPKLSATAVTTTSGFVVQEPSFLQQTKKEISGLGAKKVLIVPFAATVVEQIALAKSLRAVGHQVDFERNGSGTSSHFFSGNQKMYPRPTQIIDGPRIPSPDYSAYDVIVSGGQINKQLREAIERGQLVIVASSSGPWELSISRQGAEVAEKDYLAQQVELGNLDKTKGNSQWTAAPWGGENDSDPSMAHMGGVARKSIIRPTDIVGFRNILTYNLGVDSLGYEGKFSFGYRGEGVRDEANGPGWSDTFRIEYAEWFLARAVQQALASHVAQPVEYDTPELKQAKDVPLRPKLPRTFPLSRPSEEGTVVFWGFSEDSPSRNEAAREYLTPPKGLKAVQVVASGNEFTQDKIHCLALQKNGTVVAWGYNGQGQCNVPPDLRDVVSVAAGDGVSVAVKADGSLAIWGAGKIYDIFPKDLAQVVQVAFTQEGVLILFANGSSRFAGRWPSEIEKMDTDSHHNLVAISGGRLGFGLTEEGKVVTLTKKQEDATFIPKDLGPVAALATMDSYCCHVIAIQTDGSLRAWGRNDAGQCEVPTGLRAKAIAISNNHVAAITTEGSLVSWGSNWAGELDPPYNLSKVKFVQVFAGFGYTIALMR